MERITIDIETFDKLYKKIKKEKIKNIPFELIVGSCFPNIMDNIKEEMRRQYTMGYAEGSKINTYTS